MKASNSIVGGLAAFYDAFNSGSVDQFSDALADTDGTSVIGSAPGEGHSDRASWIKTYAEMITPAGVRLRGGPSARGFAHDGAGFVVDEPAFVLPDGSRLETRLTAVLIEEGGRWRVVHLHFSVGVPDEEAIRPPE
ncbi:nuclear transport factor 2 family protein [Lentzea sp. NBRC 105346]|uniref:nuclear transport factor 2 family protein n=1 Tax=Lentzea sp. NBRC 105346 TaxID=3032205 RepID=UPI002553D667|nr:nuclear transport factor 2 family protein [Lentzea sp. NBRC 105346]